MIKYFIALYILLALLVPHLSDESVSTTAQIFIQSAFILLGFLHAKIFN